MFGHHDDEESNDKAPENAQPAADQSDQATQTTASSDQPVLDDTPAVSLDPAIPADNAGGSQPALPSPSWQHPGAPLNDNKDQISDVISPAGGFPQRPSYQYPQGVPPTPDAVDTSSSADPELVDIRDHALDELEPLLDKLDLPSEEKFRAIMMILQANDDHKLVKKAYETAHNIKDDELRARALYDIVNEVNYFTQPPSDSQE